LKNLHRLSVVGLIILITGCSAAVKKDSPPGWVSGVAQQYPAKQYLVGRGSSIRLDDASDRARADIAKIFEVEIAEASFDSQMFEQEMASDASQDKVKGRFKVTRDIEVYTGRILRGVEIAETWQDPETGTFYTLAALKRQPAAQALREEIRHQDEATRLYISSARKQQDLLKRIAAASRAVEAQIERTYLHRSLMVITPDRGDESRWAVVNLQADRDALMRKLAIYPLVSGKHAREVLPILEGAIAKAGFSAQSEEQAQYQLKAKLELDDPVVKDNWHWLRGTFEVVLLDSDKAVRGLKRWPVKVSAQKSDATFRRALAQIDTVLKNELRTAVISFAIKD